MARLKRYRGGEMIFREGDPCPGLFIVGQGGVRVFRDGPSGKQHVLHIIYQGMTFAEVAAIGRFSCPAYAESIGNSLCVLLPQDEFTIALRDDHDLCLQLMAGMAGWVKHLVGILEDIVLRDATSRVALHLLRSDNSGEQGDFVLPMLKRDLASHLNLTSETLSRTLRRLVDAGLLEIPDQQRIRILNRAALEQVAEGLPPGEFD